jgi:ribosomal protein S18 acetylase RimI-like enzyme
VRYATRGRFILAADMSFAIRLAGEHDIAGMAALRAQTWGTAPYWAARVAGYLNGEHSPQQALAERVAFVALDEDAVVGLVAGHRTKRFGCDGELEWIDVAKECRGQGIADGLMVTMMAWFGEHGALRVCVNVAPENAVAQRFYARHGAVPLHEYWMVWNDIRLRPLDF